MHKRDNADNIEILKTSNGHGGARPGAGKPRGVKWPSTLRKEEAREKVRQFITERLGEFLEAMADNVTGIKHLMLRDPKTGQFQRVTGDDKRREGSIVSIVPTLDLSGEK